MQVKINKINIGKFRNIKDTNFDLNGRNIAFCGENRLGKTNVLNAIMWCLTGYDLSENCKDSLNAPYGNYNDGDVCIDVEVELNVGTIQRTTTYIRNSYRQTITINKLEYETQKEADKAIDEMLGITKLTLSANKDFNVRRFLLNPLYFTHCKESAFREFVIKQLNVDEKEVFDSLPESYKKLIEFKPVNVLSQENDKKIKATKKEIDYWKTIKDYYERHLKKDAPEKIINTLEQQQSILEDLTSVSVAIDKYAYELSKVYDTACKQTFHGIEIVLLEKGQTEDVWKPTCLVNSPITHTRMEYCSTSEAILSGCNFINGFVSNIADAPLLPLIFDELETLDSKSVYMLLSKASSQFVSALVLSNLEKITMVGI